MSSEAARLMADARQQADASADRALARLAQHLRGVCAGSAELTPTLALLDALPARVGRRLLATTPHFYLWRAELLKASADGDTAAATEHALALPRLLLGPLVEHGEGSVGPVLTRLDADGLLRLPGYPRDIVLAGTARGQVVSVSVDHGRTTVAWDGGRLVLERDALIGAADDPRVKTNPLIPGTAIQCRTDDPWIRQFVARNDAQQVPPYPARNLRCVDPVDASVLDVYATAWRHIRAGSAEIARIVEDNVTLVVPFTASGLVGFSAPTAVGAVFIKHVPDDVVFTVEHWVHEACHTELFRVMLTQRLFTGGTQATVTVPWRRDPRPVAGAFHGTYVFGRLAFFFRQAARADTRQPQRWQERADHCARSFAEAYPALHESPHLTPLALQILQGVAADLGLLTAGRAA